MQSGLPEHPVAMDGGLPNLGSSRPVRFRTPIHDAGAGVYRDPASRRLLVRRMDPSFLGTLWAESRAFPGEAPSFQRRRHPPSRHLRRVRTRVVIISHKWGMNQFAPGTAEQGRRAPPN